MSEPLTGYALGVVLHGLVREVGEGWRNYPASYETGRTLVGLGLAEYVEEERGEGGYWIGLTPAGRAFLAALAETTAPR